MSYPKSDCLSQITFEQQTIGTWIIRRGTDIVGFIAYCPDDDDMYPYQYSFVDNGKFITDAAPTLSKAQLYIIDKSVEVGK